MPEASSHNVTWYDAEKDADTVGKYTRQYLRDFSTTADARFRSLNDTILSLPDALAETRRIYKWLMGVLIVLALLWLAMAVIIPIAVFKGS